MFTLDEGFFRVPWRDLSRGKRTRPKYLHDRRFLMDTARDLRPIRSTLTMEYILAIRIAKEAGLITLYDQFSMDLDFARGMMVKTNTVSFIYEVAPGYMYSSHGRDALPDSAWVKMRVDYKPDSDTGKVFVPAICVDWR